MITLIVPYYRSPEMLRKQLEVVCSYSADMEVIIVDDGSPEPALDVMQEIPKDKAKFLKLPKRLRLFRILKDIPWNREMARNLGAYVARTPWIIQVDIDHILPVMCTWQLVQEINEGKITEDHWYRFPRQRIGKADFTRKKDLIPEDAETGWIKPHVDSFLITRKQFLKSPYDERYSGCLGGGTPFATRMKRVFGEPLILNDGIWLEVHTTDSVKDASITTLSRDRTEYSERRMLIGEDDKPKAILTQSPWEEQAWYQA